MLDRIRIVPGTVLSLFVAPVILGACVEETEIEQTPGIHYVNTSGKCSLGMSPDIYDSLTIEEYEQELRKLGCMPEEDIQSLLSQFKDPEKRARDNEKIERWKERTEHWDSVNAFWQNIARINEDDVVESSESLFICGVVSQWVRQLDAAQVYAQEWERDYSYDDFQAELEKAATAGHKLATGFQTDCGQLQ